MADAGIDGLQLTIYADENSHHQGKPMHERLMSLALELGLPGCSVSKLVACYGRHHRVHDDVFIELQGTLPMQVVFLLDTDQSDLLLSRLHEEQIALPYAITPVRMGVT